MPPAKRRPQQSEFISAFAPAIQVNSNQAEKLSESPPLRPFPPVAIAAGGNQLALPVLYLPNTAQCGQGAGIHQLITDQSGAIYITPSRKLSMTPFVQRAVEEASASNVAIAASSSSTAETSSSSPSAAPRLVALPSVDDPITSSVNGLSSQIPSTSAVVQPYSVSRDSAPASSTNVSDSLSTIGDGFVLRDYVHLEESRRTRFWKLAPAEVRSRISAELKALPEQHKTRAHAEKMGWLH